MDQQLMVRLRGRVVQQIDELIELVGGGVAANIITGAIDTLHRQRIRSRTSWQPTYSDFFVLASEGEEGAFRVTGQSPDGEFVTYLRPATLEEALQHRAFYIHVKHDLEYPYAVYDFEAVNPDPEVMPAWARDVKMKPVRFAQAALVAVPKAAPF